MTIRRRRHFAAFVVRVGRQNWAIEARKTVFNLNSTQAGYLQTSQ